MADKIMNYNKAAEYVKENGWDKFLELLKQENPRYNLYCVSTSWYEDNQYICKAWGKYGDLIIGWER